MKHPRPYAHPPSHPDSYPAPARIRLLVTLFLLFAATCPASAADWPNVLGPSRDGSAPDEAVADQPGVLWKIDIGTGWSGPVIADGKLIVFHRLANRAVCQALNPVDGSRIWSFEYRTDYRDSFGFDNGPRATPTIDAAANLVFIYGAEGMLHAVDLESGGVVWAVDTAADYKTDQGFFGRGSSPLVMGDTLVLVAGGGKGAGIIALNKQTGELLWKATDYPASYASPTTITLDGRTYLIALTGEALLLISPDSGEVLAETEFRSPLRASVLAASPLVHGDEVFVSAGYGAGSAVYRVHKDRFETVWNKPDVLENHYTNSVLVGGELYGFHGRQDIPPPAELRSVEWETGLVRWSKRIGGVGSINTVGDRLLILMETGLIIVAKPTPTGLETLGELQALGFGLRALPAIADGRLYARDDRQLVCVSLQPTGR